MTNGYKIEAFEELGMKHFWFARAAKFAVILIVALGVVGAIVMSLWNWLVPSLFSGPMLTYWEALGLLLLSRLLFGGLRPHGHHRHGHHHGPFGRRWRHMSDEERQRMREHLRSRRCGFGRPPSERGPAGPETTV